MDVNLLIIQYYLKKKNIVNTDKLVSSFFNNGVFFPILIETIYQIKIEKIVRNPTTKKQIKSNNDLAFEFLCQRDQKIKDMNLDYEIDSDQNKILKLIITRHCFKIDYEDLEVNCDLITHELESHNTINFFSIQNLTSLLHVLTKGLVKLDSNTEFNQSVIDNFKIANVPLLLNEKSFELQNRYQVFVQIIIISDVYPEELKDKFCIDNGEEEEEIDETKEYDIEEYINESFSEKKIHEITIDGTTYNLDLSNDSQKEKEEEIELKMKEKEIEEQKKFKEESDLLDRILLTIINLIGENGGLKFNNFQEIIDTDSLPKFIMYFFKIDSIPKVDLSKNRNLENINAVIEFLKEKEEKFRVLLLDFKNPETVKSSIKSLFVNFLNFFFLKNFNQEIDKRIDNFILKRQNCCFKYEKVIALLHLITKKNNNIVFNGDKIKNDILNDYFDNTKIPQIISEELENPSNYYYFDPWDYQLRFILNSFDTDNKSMKVIEFLFVVLKKFQSIVVPRFDLLFSSLKAKEASLKLQNLRSSKATNSNSKENKKEHQDKKIKKISEPKTFKKRLEKEQNAQLRTFKNESIEYQSPEKYWNQPSPNYYYSLDMLCDKTEDVKSKRKEFLDRMKEIKKISGDNNNDNGNDDGNDDDEDKNKAKLYKIFYYDEITQCWRFNSYMFESLADDSGIKNKKIKTPVVLYILTNMQFHVSFLINEQLPEMEDSIYVYGLCEKTLSEFNIKKESIKKQASIKPLFLILNVPYCKSSSPKIRTVVLQILTFLQSISDLEITFINSIHWNSQIKTMNVINNIIDEFVKSKKKEADESEDSSEYSCTSSFFLDCESSNSDNDNDNDDEISEEDRWENRNDYDEKSDLFKYKITLKNPPIIYLVDGLIIKNYHEKLDQIIRDHQFYTDFRSQIGKENQIHFILRKKLFTYQPFFNTLKEMLLNCTTTYADIKKNFECINIFNFSGAYVQIKFAFSSWKEEIKNLIHQRYKILDSNRKKNEGTYSLLFKLKNEIKEFLPISNDQSLSSECDKILDDLKKEILEIDKKYISSELKKSAKSHLKFLDKTLKSKYYWTEEQLQVIKESHLTFLKEEFFDIIKVTNDGKYLDIIYKENFDVIQKQMKKDDKKILKLFDEFINKIQKRNKAMVQDINEGFQRSSNYSMKETENLREIKVAVEIGENLKSIIEQDF